MQQVTMHISLGLRKDKWDCYNEQEMAGVALSSIFCFHGARLCASARKVARSWHKQHVHTLPCRTSPPARAFASFRCSGRFEPEAPVRNKRAEHKPMALRCRHRTDRANHTEKIVGAAHSSTLAVV
eukprot:352598-Chlamydomonas_euryale.AAC.26